MLKAKAFGLASLLFCGSIGGLAGEKQTDPADFAPFTVEVTRGGPIGVCTLTNPPMGKGVKFIVKPKEGEFKKGEGKILSSKSHGKNVWVAIEDSSARFVAALKSLGTEKSTLVLCGGEWANRGNGGNGNNGRAPDKWLAELSGQGEHRLFLCHQYPESDQLEFNYNCLHSTMAMIARFGQKNSLLLIVGVNADGKCINNVGHRHKNEDDEDYKCPNDEACISEGGNIGLFLTKTTNTDGESIKFAEVYSVGHGYISKDGSVSGLKFGTSSKLQPNDKVTINCTDDRVGDNHDKSNSCSISEYIGSFRPYLEENANIFLMHCFTANQTKSGLVIEKAKVVLPKSTIIGMAGIIDFTSVFTNVKKFKDENGNQIPLSQLTPYQFITKYPQYSKQYSKYIRSIPFRPRISENGRFVSM